VFLGSVQFFGSMPASPTFRTTQNEAAFLLGLTF
jgi:hypothetical protein